MPGKHITEFHSSLILIKCYCSLCVGSHLKITCKSITVLLIQKTKSLKSTTFWKLVDMFGFLGLIYFVKEGVLGFF